MEGVTRLEVQIPEKASQSAVTRDFDKMQREASHPLRAIAPRWFMETVENKPLRTRTLPDELRGLHFEGPDIVTGLHLVGTSVQYDLPRDRSMFRVGRDAECEVQLPDPYVSAEHCVLERRGVGRMRCTDSHSRHGVYVNERREEEFDVRPGERFAVSTAALMPLNDEMRAVFPALVEITGEEFEPRTAGTGWRSPTELIRMATNGAHLLITGLPGCEQQRLAHVLHAISLQRARPLVEISSVPDRDRARQREILDRASRSTLVLTIEPNAPPIDGTFLSMLFSPSFHVRIIAIAPFADKARAVLGADHVAVMEAVVLRPLADRGGAIPKLLDARFAELGSPLRTSELSPHNQAALRAYDWPENFFELRLVAERLVTVQREGSLRKASAALGMTFSSLQRWSAGIGLTAPLVPRRAKELADE